MAQQSDTERTDRQEQRTALIGLGNIGFGMARNILAAGIRLPGFDLSSEALVEFAKMGGITAGSAAEAAEGADLVILALVNAEQARQVLFGAGEVAQAMAPGGTVMLTSTVAPSDARGIAAQLAEQGLDMLDAPVSGGRVGADAGRLTIMASGSRAAFARAAPELAAISATLHDLGDAPGIGATYKVVHQLAAGVHLAAAAEMLALGARAGCDPARLHEIVMASAGASWMLGDRGPRMLEAEPQVTSAVDIFVKDMQLVLRTGTETGAVTPLAAAAGRMFDTARELGHGGDDDSMVIRAYQAQAGQRGQGD